MQLLKTHLLNVCQHADLVVDFCPGLVGIYGRNGAGKSNLLNVGAYANLTNDYSRTNGTRQKCIRRGIAKGDPSFHESWWEHNGTRFSISRDLRRESHQLKIEGQTKPLTGAKEIQAWLDATLKVKRQVIDNHLFVEQNQMFSFIDQTGAERSEVFAHLCGTTGLAKIYDALGARIAADLPLSAMPNDNSDELRARVGEAKTRRREALAALKPLQPKLLDEAERKRLQSLVDKRQRWLNYKKQQTTTLATWEELAAVVVPLEDLAQQAEVRLAEANFSAELLAGPAQEAVHALRDFQQAQKQRENLAKLQARLAALVKPKKPKPAQGDRPLQEIQDEIAVKKELLSRAQKLVKAFDEGTGFSCPLCGTQTPALQSQVEEYRDIVRTYPKLLTTLDLAAAVTRAAMDTQVRYAGQLKSYKDQAASLQESIDSFGEIVSPGGDPAEWEAAIAASRQAEAVVDQRKNNAQAARNKLRDAKIRVEESVKQLDRIVAALQANKVDRASSDDAKLKLAEDLVAAKEAAVLTERAQQAAAAIVRAEADLEAFKAAKARTKRVRLWLADLEAMRDEVFHRSKLPQVLHEDALEELIDTTNATLAEVFGDPFSVKVGEALALGVVKADGEDEAKRLSGGQKGVLAIAFRLATNSIFAGELGMMVLDEPTVGLDEENIDCLHEALTRLSAFARREGSQIIVITHDQRLETAFDRVIRLGDLC